MDFKKSQSRSPVDPVEELFVDGNLDPAQGGGAGLHEIGHAPVLDPGQGGAHHRGGAV